MVEPAASRPYMPGYGTLGESEGSGLIPWSWAEEQLSASRNYWLSTVWPDGRPHLMPVWSMWHENSLWFSSSKQSRKARNLLLNPRCSIATEDADNPVVVEGLADVVTDLGLADVVTDLGLLREVLDLENRKYKTSYGMEMLDPAVNSTFRIRPVSVFALLQVDFTGSPTRWTFEGDPSRR